MAFYVPSAAAGFREFMLGHGPNGSPRTDPEAGVTQEDIFHHYKLALMKATALDRAMSVEEKRARWKKRPINIVNIEELVKRYLARMPYKAIKVIVTTAL